MKTYSFEKLIVWQKSRNLAVIINKVTKDFPKDEIFGMISQMRRCSISIASNVAEGSGRHMAKDKARFTEIAYSSALELINQLIISLDLEYVSEKNYLSIRNEIEEITFMLDSLHKSQLKGLEKV
ncbi:four helix bundle protein [Flavobacterium aquariorum]|uniref:Four helix bundle protein n=1 Tax=Flavobacterium aquariorum TaxID=2217670 RepID=A0A2W7TV31_9FLAO|nr:four helix bundle protein [Flavobacterium aquariorum]PZX93848.1 four helix bundle protein [Flavobacterium aquariorum]